MNDNSGWKLLKTLVGLAVFLILIGKILHRVSQLVMKFEVGEDDLDEICDCEDCDGEDCDCNCHHVFQPYTPEYAATTAALSAIPARIASNPEVKRAVSSAKRTIKRNIPKLNPRQRQIHNLFKQRRQVVMKDLLTKIKGVTERTLRRDLAALESLGVIQKVGRTKDSAYKLLS